MLDFALFIPLATLPRLDAFLNGASAIFLLAGYAFIRSRRVLQHKICMLSAVACSAAFLVSYLYFHAHAGLIRFSGQGTVRPVYFAILVSHTILAAVIVPLVLITLYFALRSRFSIHRAIARWTLPIWLYVSITGVIVYYLLFVLYKPVFTL
ncbi:MAG TPA: DUF420 domain-containing protein [Verrucomicrobiae bacterium]|nr:DUF420 domain-containing protein [Verrucomicrobiae bacterium]